MWITAGAILLGGCQGTGVSWSETDPYAGPWALGFLSPYAMDAWVEESATVDADGNFYRRILAGVVGGGKKNLGNGPAGWSRGWLVTGAGAEREVLDAKLPMSIYVRWQSLVEPQVYDGWIRIPESARQLMHRALTEECPEFPPEWSVIPKKASVRLGLAPGGIVKVWVLDECRKPVEIKRVQVEVVGLGPNLGRSKGRYLPVTELSKRYIDQYGIPYGSW